MTTCSPSHAGAPATLGYLFTSSGPPEELSIIYGTRRITSTRAEASSWKSWKASIPGLRPSLGYPIPRCGSRHFAFIFPPIKRRCIPRSILSCPAGVWVMCSWRATVWVAEYRSLCVDRLGTGAGHDHCIFGGGGRHEQPGR